ncbi:MAG: methylmalonyl Co-A mutase-associated GTPase MeaB [Cyclobacteriaceae bacterium]|nr:methylmalonyl Co-A mutase-associated GTPase MeaB [Cyclobacteriaceae bacterium]
MPARKTSLTALELEQGIRGGVRAVLAKAITLAESTHARDQKKIRAVLKRLLPLTGNAIRIGITGVPGVGKSTFIEAFGEVLTRLGKKVAVLTVDPTSQKTKGSILGDKTRMEKLSRNPSVFIRPSPTGTALGGVTYHTREAMLLCEAAGFDVILIETVGVGQSETIVRNMVDFFLLLMLAGAGDELQGIKKGIMEMADGILITKADGNNVKAANEAKADALQALHFQQTPISGWKVKVLTVSSLENKGIEEAWRMIQEYDSHARHSGYLEINRGEQQVKWVDESLEQTFRQELESPKLTRIKSHLINKIRKHDMLPSEAADELWRAIGSKKR